MSDTKQVVRYMGEVSVDLWPWSKPEEPIHIGYLDIVLDHPNLGRCRNVRTSQIVTMPDDSGKFETLNTIYVKVEDDNEKNI